MKIRIKSESRIVLLVADVEMWYEFESSSDAVLWPCFWIRLFVHFIIDSCLDIRVEPFDVKTADFHLFPFSSCSKITSLRPIAKFLRKFLIEIFSKFLFRKKF